MFEHLYEEKKAADAAIYLLVRANEPMHLSKLNKLLYLAERESFGRNGSPLTGDTLVTFDQGPALLHTYQRLNGELSDWDMWLADMADHMVTVRDLVLDAAPAYFSLETVLSDAEIGVLDSVWGEFGVMSQARLVDFIFMNCREWTDDQGNPRPLTHQRLFRALNYTAEETNQLMERLAEIDSLNQLYAESAV